MKARVLVIDDDEKLGELLKEYLEKFDYQVQVCLTPGKGLKLIESQACDILILDVMLPEMDGFEVCRQIRKFSSLPIIMLTARGDVTDRIVGMELGADDYLGKPFEPRELEVRIQAVLRRSQGNGVSSRIAFGDLTLDPETRTVRVSEQEVDLSTAEFDVLLLLVQNPGRTFNRNQIIDRIKGTDWATFDRSVDVLISRLRSKLGDDPKQPHLIKTIWGTGYRFVGHRREG